MIEKLSRHMQVIFYLMLVLSLLCISFLAGSRTGKDRHNKQEARYEQVNNIAVVNLDEGILINSQQVNYGAEFLTYSLGTMEPSSLEEAKRGIQEGRYAAYIVIPAAFSESIESINTTPIKAALEYAVNPNLSAEAKEQATDTITSFKNLLNFNISYVYVSAILSEFHTVQDFAGTIMQNDINELLYLSDINGNNLPAGIAYPEIFHLPNEIESFDVSAVTESNLVLAAELGNKLDTGIKQGQDEFLLIKSDSSTVTTALDHMYTTLNAYDPLRLPDGTLTYAQGMQSLNDNIDVYNTRKAEKTAALETALRAEIDIWSTNAAQNEVNNATRSYQQAIDQALGDIQAANQQTINVQLEAMQAAQNDTYALLEAYVNQELTAMLEELKDIYQAEVDRILADYELGKADEEDEPDGADKEIEIILSAIPADWSITFADSGIIFPDLEGTGITLKTAAGSNAPTKSEANNVWIALTTATVETDAIAAYNDTQTTTPDLNTAINGLFGISKLNITTTINQEIMEKIKEENARQLLRYVNERTTLITKMSAYEDKLNTHDPYQYIDKNNLSNTLEAVNNNIRTIELTQNTKNIEYLSFVDKVYQENIQNTSGLIKSLEEADMQTAANVVKAIDDLKANRTRINIRNVEMLSDFSSKLAYTRKGSLGNTMVYDFIVEPVTFHEAPVKASAFAVSEDYDTHVFIGTIIFLSLAAMAWLMKILGKARNYLAKPKETISPLQESGTFS